MKWSSQQERIFDWFEQGQGNLVVRARAGTGKTTTIIEGINRAPENKILLAAFNKRIADELNSRIANASAQARTLHALGFSFVRRYWNSVQVDQHYQRVNDATRKVMGDQAPDEIARMVGQLATKARELLPLAESPAELLPLAAQFDCVPDDDWEDDGYGADTVARLAFDVMQYLATARDGLIDFADMIFLPIKNRWVRPLFDLVVIDEAQDMAGAQLLLAEGACGGRLAVVGDDRQAIYGFRGADSGSIDRLKAAYQAHELPLTITYRCPRLIVEHAARIVPDFQAASEAPEGRIDDLHRLDLHEEVRPGDFVLSRLNAPLAGLCLELLRHGIPAKVEGKDIGKTLVSRVRKFSRRSDTLEDMLERFDTWLVREKARKTGCAEADAVRRERVEDIVGTVYELCAGLRSVSELVARIDSLFTDGVAGRPQVVCSTVHKAKGLEAKNVFLLQQGFELPWLKGAEEPNIKYVAMTRAKERLIWVNTDCARKGDQAPVAKSPEVKAHKGSHKGKVKEPKTEEFDWWSGPKTVQ